MSFNFEKTRKLLMLGAMSVSSSLALAGNISSKMPAYLGFWCNGFVENEFFGNLELDGTLKHVEGVKYSGPTKAKLVSAAYSFEETVTLTATLNVNEYYNDYFSISLAAEDNPTLGGLHGLLYTDSYYAKPSILKDGQGNQYLGECSFIVLEDRPR